MGSTFVTSPKTIKQSFGKKEKLPVYFQFVPGIVYDVVTSKSSLRAGDSNPGKNVNSIIAKPHIHEGKIIRDVDLKTEKYRYYPLLRGMVDVPTKGDPVLLCTFGKIKYYMGPLNTQNDVNLNVDTMKDSAGVPKGITTAASLAAHMDPNYQFLRDKFIGDTPENKNFIESGHHRLEKKVNNSLDQPHSSDRGKLLPEAYNEVHGDMMFEGRHGNSIRIGSRHMDPYIYISNGRYENASFESLGDGSLISITSNGDLLTHFAKGNSTPQEMDSVEAQVSLGNSQTLILPSDRSKAAKRSIMKTFLYFTRGDTTSTTSPLMFQKPQIFITSERLTFSSRFDDIYLSSGNDIHMGALKNINISSNGHFIINASMTCLGLPHTSNDRLVLGNKLMEVLKDILVVLRKSHSLHNKVPIQLVDDNQQDPKPLKDLIPPIERKLNKILSKYHFIERNSIVK